MKADRKVIVEQLWQLTYETFEKRPGNAIRTVTGANGQANEVQFRLMQQIAALKSGGEVTDAVRQTLWADVQVSHVMGWMTDETHAKMIDLLDQLT